MLTKKIIIYLLLAAMILPLAGCSREEEEAPAVNVAREMKLPEGTVTYNLILLDDGVIFYDIYKSAAVFADFVGNIQNEIEIVLDIDSEEWITGIEFDEGSGNTYVKTQQTTYIIDPDGNLTSEPNSNINEGTDFARNNELREMVEATINLTEHGEDIQKLVDARILPDGDIICAFYDDNFQVSHIVRFAATTADDPEYLEIIAEQEEKEVITLYALEIESWLNAYIIDFNRNSSEYRIETTTFMVGDDFESGLLKLNTELTAGNIPDIIVYNYHIPVRVHAERGLITDLYEIMENDPGFNMDEYIPSVFAASEIGGKLYSIFPVFQIYTASAKTAGAGSDMGWTLDEYSAFLDANPEAVYPYWIYTKRNFINEMLYMLFIDPVTYDINFDREAFLQVLEIAERFPDSIDDANIANFNAGAKNGDPLALFEVVTSFMSLKMSQIYFGEEFTYKGYPGVSGNGAYFYSDARFAITDSSASKEGAWEFLKYMLDKNIDAYNNLFPVRIDNMDELIEKATSEEGKWTIAIGDESGIVTYDIEAATEEEIAQVMALINSTTQVRVYDRTIATIIADTVSSYTDGHITAEQAADDIESRVNLYLSEMS